MMHITVHGTETALLGKEQSVGKEAPAARITKLDGSQNVIGMIAPTVQLLIAIPSLKTEICSLGAKKSIDGAELVIDSNRNFAKKYGLLISEGKLKDRLARAVYVIDREGVIVYKELVSEIVDEVDYDACIEALRNTLKIRKKGHTHEAWMSL